MDDRQRTKLARSMVLLAWEGYLPYVAAARAPEWWEEVKDDLPPKGGGEEGYDNSVSPLWVEAHGVSIPRPEDANVSAGSVLEGMVSAFVLLEDPGVGSHDVWDLLEGSFNDTVKLCKETGYPITDPIFLERWARRMDEVLAEEIDDGDA